MNISLNTKQIEAGDLEYGQLFLLNNDIYRCVSSSSLSTDYTYCRLIGFFREDGSLNLNSISGDVTKVGNNVNVVPLSITKQRG